MRPEDQDALDAFKAANVSLTTKKIVGYTRSSHPAGGPDGVPIETSMVSHIHGNLWMGGTPADLSVKLPAYFRFVLNLYPWENYGHDALEVRKMRLYDGVAVPDPKILYELAAWVVERVHRGPTLVHCQAGLNRSGLVCALALMIMDDLSAHDAIKRLREARAQTVLCNPHFEAWLLAHDAKPLGRDTLYDDGK